MTTFRGSKDGSPSAFDLQHIIFQAFGRAGCYRVGVTLPMVCLREFTYRLFGEIHGVDMTPWLANRRSRTRGAYGLDKKFQQMIGFHKANGFLDQERRGDYTINGHGVARARKLDGLEAPKPRRAYQVLSRWLDDNSYALMKSDADSDLLAEGSRNLSLVSAMVGSSTKGSLDRRWSRLEKRYLSYIERPTTPIEAPDLSTLVETPNLTAQWLQTHFDHAGGMENSPLHKLMCAAVASKCSVSKASGQVEDHVSTCITRLMHRDSLRNRIMLGRSITTSHLCTYAVRSAWSDARNSGTNPVCREMYGARTETERRNALEAGTEDRRWAINDRRVHLTKGEDGVSMLLDIVVHDHDKIEDSLYFESVWDLILDEMQRGKPKAFERYIQVIRTKLRGGTMNDIANELDVSVSRASAMLAEARRVLREARDEGRLDQFLV